MKLGSLSLESLTIFSLSPSELHSLDRSLRYFWLLHFAHVPYSTTKSLVAIDRIAHFPRPRG